MALADAGAQIGVHFHTSESDAEQTVRLIRERGAEAQAFRADLSDASEIEELIRSATHTFGGLGILVNSASIFEPTPWPLEDAAWVRHLEINLTAPMRLIRAATPHLRVSRGAVVNIIDASWRQPTWKHHSAYCISKSALAALTQNLSHVLAPEVRINGVAPGVIDMPQPASFTAHEQAASLTSTPQGRFAAPEEVAGTVLAMLRNDYITGEIINVDGGRSI